jgi:hypothetical protein
MSVTRHAAFILFLALGSCQGSSEPASCGGASDCLASAPGVVIGRDASARRAAGRELLSAATSYSAWFPGEKAAPGLIVLDKAAAGKASLVRGTLWTLKYDLAAKPALDGGLPRPAGPKAATHGAWGNGTSLAVSQENGEFDVTRPGVLAHEICHRHASRAFARTWRRRVALPDMLDEVAAISCEGEELRAARFDLFARLFADGKVIPWDGFLVTKHPLKSDPATIRALASLGNSGRDTVTFEIKRGSSYERKVALFYSQAAVFGDFLATHSCQGRQAIGNLLVTYDPRETLDQWLRSNGTRLCLETSVGEFEEAFWGFMKQRNAVSRAPGRVSVNRRQLR